MQARCMCTRKACLPGAQDVGEELGLGAQGIIGVADVMVASVA